MRSSYLFHIRGTKWGWKKGFLLIVISMSALICNAQSNLEPMDIKVDGEVWIEGEAGIFDYKCTLQQLSQASDIFSAENPMTTIADSQTVDIAFSFPVTSFSCDKSSINKDLYEALKYQSHPSITFQLMKATPQKEITDTVSSSWIPINTQGTMEMAGVEESTKFAIEGKILGNHRYQVKGSNKIHMDNYSIEPPSTMGGMVTADKILSVHFDVEIELKNSEIK